MARSRFENLNAGRREEILAAAAVEFVERGYTGASLSRIIEAGGLSKGSLYYYFEDKEDLFVTTVNASLDRILGEAGGFELDHLDAETFWEAWRELGVRSSELMDREEWYIRLAMAFPRLRAEQGAREGACPALEWFRQFTEKLLALGQELGTVRRDLPLDLLVEVTMACDEAGDRWMMEHRGDFDEEGFRALIEARLDMFRDMLDAEHEGWNR